MNLFKIRSLLVLLITILLNCNLRAQTSARLVWSELVWASDKHVVDTDLVRFKNQWIMACCESTEADHREGSIRIIISKDGLSWELLASIDSPIAGKLLSCPRLTVQPNGHLMLTAVGIVSDPQAEVPLPEFGGTVQTLAWLSHDGRTWSQAASFGSKHTLLGKAVWFNDQAFSYSRGSVCGNAKTVWILSTKNIGRELHAVYKETFDQFFPGNASLVFVDDLGMCLMSRVGDRGELKKGMLGKSKAPFDRWDWTETDSNFSSPNSIMLADNRVLLTVGMNAPKTCKMLCELILESGQFTELLELPRTKAHSHCGMSLHDGHLWISFETIQGSKKCAYLAKIRVE